MARSASVDDVRGSAHRTSSDTAISPWLTRLGRFGFAARGAVYFVLGALALRVAVGAGGQLTDQQGVFAAVLQQPFGKLLLSLLAVGLVGYALWRMTQGVADTEAKGDDAKGLAARAGYFVVGLIYGGLAYSAARLVLRDEQSGDATQEWTGRLMAQPFGRWMVALVGLIVLGVGLYLAYKGYSTKFRDDLRLGEMSPTEQTWALRVGRVGYMARGVVFVVIGGFLLLAALRFDPEEARGIGGALEALVARPFGPWLLGSVALGLVAYGLYCLFEARYRRMVKARG